MQLLALLLFPCSQSLIYPFFQRTKNERNQENRLNWKAPSLARSVESLFSNWKAPHKGHPFVTRTLRNMWKSYLFDQENREWKHSAGVSFSFSSLPINRRAHSCIRLLIVKLFIVASDPSSFSSLPHALGNLPTACRFASPSDKNKSAWRPYYSSSSSCLFVGHWDTRFFPCRNWLEDGGPKCFSLYVDVLSSGRLNEKWFTKL